MNTETKTILRDIRSLCRSGYALNDASYYDVIVDKLEGVEQTETIEKIRRMAKAGPTLSSKKFAYPHIEDIVRGLLEE